MIQPAVSVTTTVLANDTFSEINPIFSGMDCMRSYLRKKGHFHEYICSSRSERSIQGTIADPQFMKHR